MQVVTLPGAANHVVFGQVTGVHIRDDILTAGRVDVSAYRPLARMGYQDYAVIDAVFALHRPG